MSIVCTVRGESFTTAEQLSALLGKKITPEVANKLIEEAEREGYLERSDDGAYDLDDVLEAVSRLSDKSGKYQGEEKAGIETATALYGSFQDKDDGKDNKLSAFVDAARILDIEHDSRTILSTEHDFIREPKAKTRGMLVDSFGGNFAVMTAVTKGLANTAIEAISGYIRNNAMKFFDKRIANLEKMKKDGVDEKGIPLTRNKLSKLEADIESLIKRRNNVYDNGIYAMAEDSELVTAAINHIKDNLRSHCVTRAAGKKYMKEGHSREEAVKYVREKYPSLCKDLIFKAISNAVKKLEVEKNVDFIAWLYDGYIDSDVNEKEVFIYTDEEHFRAMEAKLEGVKGNDIITEVGRARIAQRWWKRNRDYSWSAREGEDEAETRRREEGRERDRQIKERRAASDARLRELISGILMELTNRTGVAFSLSYKKGEKERGVSQEVEDAQGENEDVADGTDEEVTDESTDEDMYEEEQGRDAQYVEAFERSAYSTVRGHTKRVLANLLQYSIEKGDGGNNIFVPISEYCGHRTIDPMVAFSHFLTVIPEQNNGKGFADSEALYEWLKEQQNSTPWYHGIVMEMERNPKLKTEFFNSFNKELTQFRSVHMRGTAKEESGTGETNISYGENSCPQMRQVMSDIRSNMNNGINLQTDTYYKGMVVERGSDEIGVARNTLNVKCTLLK